MESPVSTTQSDTTADEVQVPLGSSFVQIRTNVSKMC